METWQLVSEKFTALWESSMIRIRVTLYDCSRCAGLARLAVQQEKRQTANVAYS